MSHPVAENTKIFSGTFLLVVLMASMGAFLTDMYAPSFPAMTHDLHTTEHAVKTSMTAFFLSFSFGQLLFGPLSDKLGRRKVILVGFCITGLGSLFCMFAHSITTLIIGRFIQGLGAASTTALGRSIMRDIFKSRQMAKAGAYMGMSVAIAPALSPVIGGFLQMHFGWHASFIVETLYVVIIGLCVLFRLPETNQHMNPNAFHPTHIVKNYWAILKSPVFVSNATCAGLCFAAILGYITIAAFLFQNILHVNPQTYGYLMMLSIASMFMGRFITARLLQRVEIHTIIFLNAAIAGLSAITMGVLSLYYLNLWVIVIPSMIFLAMINGIFPCTMAGALTPFKDKSGSAGALYGGTQMAGAFTIAIIITHIHSVNQRPLTEIFFAIACLIIICNYFSVRAKH